MATEVPPDRRGGEVGQRTGNGRVDAHENGAAPAVLVEQPATAVAQVAVPAPSGAPPKRSKPTLAETFEAFRFRDFRYLMLSTLAVGFGQWAKQIGLFWLTIDLTGSAAQLGFVAGTRGIIGTVVAPIGGVLADRYPRRVIVLASTFAEAVFAAILAGLVITDSLVLWHIYAITLATGGLQSINQPARQAFVYDVTTDETLPNAIALNSIVQNVSRITGPPLTGAMIGFIGLWSPFIFIVVVQTIATAMTFMISRATRQQRVSGGNPMAQTVEGFKYSWQEKGILGLIVVHAVPSFLVYPYIPFLAIIAEDVLGGGATEFGFLSSAMGWGSIVGLFLLAFMGNRQHKGWIMLGCFLIYTTMLIGFSASTNLYVSLAILATAGIFHSIAMALNNTLIQLAVRNEMRGRVMAVWQMTQGLQPLGSFPMGLLIAAVGPQIGIGSFMVTATVAFVLVIALWGSVRRM